MVGQVEFTECVGKAIESRYHEWVGRCGGVPYLAAGILPSEIMTFCAVCLEQGVDRVFESGRKFGYSTEILCRWTEHWMLRSCETTPVADRDDYLLNRYPESIIAPGDGLLVLPRWTLDAADNHRIAVLCDGPKGFAGLELMDRLSDRLVLYALHDVLSDSVLAGRLQGRTRFLTDRNDEWLAKYGEMDDQAYVVGGYGSRAEMTRESYGLALFPGGRWRT